MTAATTARRNTSQPPADDATDAKVLSRRVLVNIRRDQTTETPRELRLVSFGTCHTSFGFAGSATFKIDVPFHSSLPVIGFSFGFWSQ